MPARVLITLVLRLKLVYMFAKLRPSVFVNTRKRLLFDVEKESQIRQGTWKQDGYAGCYQQTASRKEERRRLGLKHTKQRGVAGGRYKQIPILFICVICTQFIWKIIYSGSEKQSYVLKNHTL